MLTQSAAHQLNAATMTLQPDTALLPARPDTRCCQPMRTALHEVMAGLLGRAGSNWDTGFSTLWPTT